MPLFTWDLLLTSTPISQAAAKPAAAEAAASQAASASGSGMARPWALAQQPHAGRWGAQTGVPRAWSSAKPRPGGAAAGAAAATKGAAAAGGGAAAGEAQSRSPFERWWAAFQSVPPVPKLLGVTGAIPFIALSPPVSKHLFWILPHDVIDNSAMFQVGGAGRGAVLPRDGSRCCTHAPQKKQAAPAQR